MLFDLVNVEYKINEQRLLRKLSINIKEGNHHLILGPSGSGKTTLINLMAGLLRPTSGQIFFKKKNYEDLSDNEIDNLRATKYGLVFQKLHLIAHLTVEQNIAIVCNKKEPKDIDELICDLGLETKRKKIAKELSFGEAQRVAIARGLSNNPEVIFADEPTSALDDENVKNVINLLLMQSKKNKSTLIICTHDDRIKSYFKNIMEIKHE